MKFQEEVNTALEALKQTEYKQLNSKTFDLLLCEDQYKVANVLNEYAVFVQNAIKMLLEARISGYNYKNLCAELDENIQEELGSMTNNVPHLEMMRDGYRDVGLIYENNTDNPDTKYLIDFLFTLFRNNGNDLDFLAGLLIGFEHHAIEEYYILQNLIEIYTNEELTTDSILGKYVLGHQQFEIGHTDHLVEAYVKDLEIKGSFKKDSFERGFTYVSCLLNNWWTKMNQL